MTSEAGTESATPVSLTRPGPVRPVRNRRHGYLGALSTWQGSLGLGLLAMIVLVALLGPALLQWGPKEQGSLSLSPPGEGGHLLGTDEVGRNLLARLLQGTRTDLQIVLIAVPLSAVLGTALGMLGMLAARWGAVVQRIFDVLLGVPGVVLGVAVALTLDAGKVSVIIAVVLITIPLFGRQARTSMLNQTSQDYVAAAEVLGFSRLRITARHILPNIVDVLIVRFAIEMAHAVTIEGSLSVIGLGVQSPEASLGEMIKNGSSYLSTTPLYALAPIGVVLVMVIACTLLANALNKAVLRT